MEDDNLNKFYYKDGIILQHYEQGKVLHRVDGPAIKYYGTHRYYIDGRKLSKEDFNKYQELAKIIYE
jgi:hypothetical protein